MIMLQDTAVRNVENFYWKSMENTENVWCVRTVPADIKRTISRVTNARCPVCHKKMEMVGEGEGQKFVCVCGYKEKLSAFKQRKEKQGSGMSKKEVNRYLKKQQKEAQEPINNAFAEAFSKIKL